MLAKMARSAPRSPFGVPRMTAIVRAAKRSCRNAAKAQKLTTVRGSSGEFPDQLKTPQGRGRPGGASRRPQSIQWGVCPPPLTGKELLLTC